MKHRYLLSLLSAANLLVAQDIAPPAPCPAQEAPAASPELHALVILQEPAAPGDFAEYCGVISDVLPTTVLQDLEVQFLGKPVSKPMLEEIRKQVLEALAAKQEFALRAFYPEQDISSGVVVLQIAFPTTAEVEVKGNQWQTPEVYKQALGLSPGDPLDIPQVLTNTAWFNRNPFHFAEVVVSPGNQEGSVNVDFLVKDRWIFRPFAGMDNTGTDATMETRWYAGCTWGKPFGRNDVLTYQYISAPDPRRFYSHSGSYLAFLPNKHELLFFGGFSKCHPDIPHFTQEGITVQASMRHTIPVSALYKGAQSSFSWGLDYKNMNSNVFFAEVSPTIPVITHQVNLSQLYLSFTRQDRFLAKVEMMISPLRMLPHESDVLYNALRPEATAQYVYAKVALSDSYGSKDKGFVSWTARAQAASGPLLPSEQFALGGYDTVRGYLERDYLADNAFCLNVELHMPKLGFTKKDELVFLAFTDVGVGYNHESEQSIQTSQHLWSVGPGLRYRIGPYFNVRADYGFQLHHIFDQEAFGRFHLGGSLSY